ncbi:hypothetical protein MsAc7_08360 [Methanolapillus millepedarum]|uniref:Uncharacterized protein n=1 Tax=Methanolapillus millepedarum TaxID=3028296 RepID=A0AA96V4C4_9EURY|nr:hypothetical protein MsAc7_08360 [Methanosarcinaceae archaeon Ac7]
MKKCLKRSTGSKAGDVFNKTLESSEQNVFNKRSEAFLSSIR